MKKGPILLALAATSGIANAQFFDDFNRADSTNMGSNWTEQLGDFQIVNNQAKLVSSSGWMSVNGLNASPTSVVVSADAFELSAGVSYVALESGVLSQSQMIFAKIQDNNSDGLFDRVFFYYGNNGSGWASPSSFNLATPTSSAHISLYMSSADVVNFDVDRNFDSITDESFSVSGASALTLGTGFGVGLFGNGAVDNYRVSTVPEPFSLGALGVGCIALLRRRRR